MHGPAIFVSVILIVAGIYMFVYRQALFEFTVNANNRMWGKAGRVLEPRSNVRQVSILSVLLIFCGVGLAVWGVVGN